MIRRVFKFSFLALICGASLSACGGGGGAPATVQTDPTSAQAPSQGTGGTASSNPASGLVDYGRALRPYTALAKPAKGVSVADPDFPGNTRIVRVTDVAADFKAGVAVPVYPTIQSWNCDESLLFLYITSPQSGGQSGHALFDGKTYKFIKFIDINIRIIYHLIKTTAYEISNLRSEAKDATCCLPSDGTHHKGNRSDIV